MRVARLWTLCLAVFLAGCGGNSTTSPSSQAVTTTWSGQLQSTTTGSVSLILHLSQTPNDTAVSGVWESSAPDPLAGGTLKGTLNGSQISLNLTSLASACSTTLTGNIVGSNMTLVGSGFSGKSSCTTTSLTAALHD